MELTEAERGRLYEAIRDSMPIAFSGPIYTAVEEILEARMAALTPEPRGVQFNRERQP
jgi:hypothetical protein